jgi:hypothetical protein
METPKRYDSELLNLLVEADAIVKLCYLNEPVPGDPENAVQGTALAAASRLLNQAMEKLP